MGSVTASDPGRSPHQAPAGAAGPTEASAESPAESPDVGPDVGLDFDDFYARARPSLVRALSLALGDVELATDAVDEALARAVLHWRTVRTMGNPEGWVYRVALNWARSVARWRRRRRRVDLPPERTYQPTVSEPAVLRALAALPIDQRSVVVCRLLLEFSELQTAEALGIKVGTVKSRLSRGTAQLRTQLAPLMEVH